MEQQFKLSFNHTSLGDYTVESLHAKIEDIIIDALEAEFEKPLEGIAINFDILETPIIFFSCVYEGKGKQITIPFETSLRGRDVIGNYLLENGMSPDPSEYKLVNVYVIPESDYIKYTDNRDADDPLNVSTGNSYTYYKVTESNGNVQLLFTTRTFQSESPLKSYVKKELHLDSNTYVDVKVITRTAYYKDRLGIDSTKNFTHYIIYKDFTDSWRSRENLATLSTKLSFDNDNQIKEYLVHLKKIKSIESLDGVTIEKADKKSMEAFASKIKKQNEELVKHIPSIKSKHDLSDSEVEIALYECEHDDDV